MASTLLACSLAALSVVASLSPPAGVPSPALLAPEAEAETEGEGENDAAPGASSGDYDAAVAAIDEANIAVNRDPEANLASLEQAIAELMTFGPQIASDPKGREALDLSQLNLARALLTSEDEAKATEVMDAVLMTALDRKLPIKRFGPTLVNFHDKRRKALDKAGTGSIQVLCRVACRVVIDEQQATASSGPLYLGTHRVWIEAADGSALAEHHELELVEAGVTAVVNYPAEVDDDECELPPPPPPPEPPPPPPKRILPRWAEIGVAVIGIGAVAAGGVLLGLDGKCPGGGDPVMDAPDCPELYEGTASGIVAVGVGSALVVTGGVMLAIDEVRVGKQTGRQAVLTWQLRF